MRPASSWSWPSVGEICSTEDTSSASGSEPYFSTLASVLACRLGEVARDHGAAAEDRRARRTAPRLHEAVEHDRELVLRRRFCASWPVDLGELRWRRRGEVSVDLPAHAVLGEAGRALPISVPSTAAGSSRYFSEPSVCAGDDLLLRVGEAALARALRRGSRARRTGPGRRRRSSPTGSAGLAGRGRARGARAGAGRRARRRSTASALGEAAACGTRAPLAEVDGDALAEALGGRD